MKKQFFWGVLLIFIGNCIITIAEKVFYVKSDLTQLQYNLFNAKANTNVAAMYPASLLFSKMLIWLATFAIIATILFFIKVQNKKIIRNGIIVFYMLGCLINVLNVPHPIWFIAAVIPFTLVPFITVENILETVTKAISINKQMNADQNKSYKINLG